MAKNLLYVLSGPERINWATILTNTTTKKFFSVDFILDAWVQLKSTWNAPGVIRTDCLYSLLLTTNLALTWSGHEYGCLIFFALIFLKILLDVRADCRESQLSREFLYCGTVNFPGIESVDFCTIVISRKIS